MSIKIQKDQKEKFLPLITRIKQRVQNLSRSTERGLVNNHAKTSFSMRDDGTVNTVAGKYAQDKMSENKTQSISMQDVDITNSKKISADEVILNSHKLNNLLYEYTDLKSAFNNDEKLVGALQMQSTVMVKAWEPSLKRYVMIRRPARFAVFGPEVNIAKVPDNLSIDTEMQSEFQDAYDIEKAASQINDFSNTESESASKGDK